MGLKRKTIAALEKQVELLNKDGLTEAVYQRACSAIRELTNLLSVLNDV